MTELAKQQHRSVLEVDIDQSAILRHLGLDANDPAAQALVLTCQRYGLDPILKHALLIEKRLYVTRDGLLHVAHRSGQLDGIEVLSQDETESHFIAKVAVYRKDMSRPFAFVGRFPKRRPVYEWSGPKGNRKKKKTGDEIHPYGPEMAVKCAEVMGLRRAFDVSLSAREEMWDQDEVVTHTDVKASIEAGSNSATSTGAVEADPSAGASTRKGEGGREASTHPAAPPHESGSPDDHAQVDARATQEELDGGAEAGSTAPAEASSVEDPEELRQRVDSALDMIDKALTGQVIKLGDIIRTSSPLFLKHNAGQPVVSPKTFDRLRNLPAEALEQIVEHLKLTERVGA